MPDDEQIEICAKVNDSMVEELAKIRSSARRGQYDRQSARQIDYAMRALKRAAERIRALKGISEPPAGSDQ